MENKDQNASGVGYDDGTGVTSGMVVVPDSSDTAALSAEPLAVTQPPPDELTIEPKRSWWTYFGRMDVILAVLLVGATVTLFVASSHRTKQPSKNANISSQYNTQEIPLGSFIVSQEAASLSPSNLIVNGTLRVNGNGLIVSPSVQPSAPTAGQLYFDQNTHQLAYYNGTGYVALTSQGVSVQSIGGATGAITLGGGLSVVNNQLTAAFPPAVTSLGGATGALTVGSGLKLVGNDLQNNGVIGLTSGTPNLVISSDGDGNLTISNVGSGSGTVTSGGGTPGRLAKFTGVQNIEDSLVSESGSTVTIGGNLSITGTLALSTVLSVANGGTGAGSLPANGVVIGNGTSAFTGVTSSGPGLCLVSTAGAPAFQACSGVGSVNGLTGAITIANATGSVNTITIDDAGTSNKGIASFNGTNFTVSGGAVNTVQDIGATAAPTFAGVNTNAITPSSTLNVGAGGQTLSLLGNASSSWVVIGGGQSTSLGFTGSPTGTVNYTLDRSAAAGTYSICTTAANCVSLGGGVTTAGGTANRLSKFTGSQTVGDSSVSDDGLTVTVLGTANLVVQGGAGTFGTLTQAGSIVLSDGSTNTATITIAGHTANHTYTIPDVGGDADFCLSTGNCSGGGGGSGAPSDATYLVASLNGTLTNERALGAGNNVSLTDGGANGTLTVATVQNPTFTTSVTTPVLQSSGALTIASAAGAIIAVDAGTTIELQDSTNVTGNLDVSGGLDVGSSNAFQVSAAGVVTSAMGITSAGTVTFTGLNCTGNANGGTVTTNASGQLICSDDEGASASAIIGSGTNGTIPMFNGVQSITNSIIVQSGTTITIAGSLNLNSALAVNNGGTGTTSLTTNGVLYGNGTSALQVTAAGTSGQVLLANASGVPTFVTVGGDVAISNTGTVTVQPDAIALGTDTTGNYVSALGSLTGLTATGNSGEGSTPTLSVNYGSIANTAVQGNVTLTCPTGIGNLSGGGSTITLGNGGNCGNLSISDSPTFATSVTTPAVILTGAGSNGTVQVGNLGQGTVYTLPDPGAATATICLATGNCAAAGTAGGDLTGSFPNPTIAKLQGTNLAISAPSGGHILVYNATNSQWETHAITGDMVISEAGAATIQANSVALGTDTTGNYVLGITAGTGVSVTGSAGEGWTPTINTVYGSSAGTAVEGNTSITVSAGTNLSGGGSITLGGGGTVTLNVASSPTFSGTLAVQGATATVGTAAQQGSVVLYDGSSNTGTLQTAALGQNTVYTLPDPSAASATICLSTGNCAGAGGGVTTTGGTTNRLSKFTASQTLGDSVLSDDGSTVTVNGTANFLVQGGTGTFGTLTQAGTLIISDGSSNTVTIAAAGLSADRVYTLPDAGGDATLCVNSGNCIGGSGGAPNGAEYLVASLNGTLTNERALGAGSNLSITDGGANGTLTVATVQNPTFTTSVTTPVLQSSGALTISSAAGQTVAIDAGTTIELQDSTNVTGSLDVSVALNVGTANAFQVNSSGAITTATGITSSGTITFSGLDCTAFANGGALTTNASGQLTCSDDDGGSGSAISGSGTSGKIALFTGSQTIGNSIVTQSGTTITIAGDLTLNTALSVANGGTGATSFTSRGVLYGNGTGAVQVTAAPTSGQVLVANASGVPTFVSFSGDVAVSDTGATTIQADSVALGTDTTGNYVASLGTLTGLSATGNSGEGSTPTLSVNYGSIANTAVQGNVTLTCPAGTGNLSGGGGSITLGAGGSCGNISIVNNPTFTTSVTTPSVVITGAGSNGTIQVGNLGQGTVYTLPDPGAATATICLATGNCAAAGTAGGDLTGSFPNPTIAKLQGTNLSISSPSGGHILVYNATNSQWENHAITGDIAITETGATTVQANAVALGTDTTGNYVLGLTAGTGTSVTGSAGEGWTPTVSVLYGSSAGNAVEGNTSISVAAGTNLTGGGSITLGAGGTVTLNVANSPTFSGTLTVQGATATIGTAAQQGSVVLSDGSSNTGTLQTAALGQNTTYTLPDPSAGSATICLSTGNCAGAGSGVTTTGGTTNRISKFTGAQALGDSTLSDDGSTVTINGTANFVVQGGTGTFGTLTQAGTVAVSDGSSNTVSIVAAGLSADRTYTLPDAGAAATFCMSSGNCIGTGGGGAPNDATYLLTSLNGTLSNERALNAGSNISFTDGGANGNFTVATVQNPTFTTSVTTPALQSSGALTISSAAGNTVAIDAGTTIELQDSTNVTGSLDVSVALNVGTANAFQVNSSGAITSATGITSSGTITFSGLDCTSFANGGALTANASGQISCSNDDGAAAGTITGSGTSGTLALFSGAQAIGDSIVTQSGTTITIAGDLTLNTALSVANGGTGATSLTARGVLYGNGTGAVQVTAAPTSAQVLVANASGVPTFVSFSGDVAVSNTGVTTIQADSVALGTDTTGNYVATLGTLTGLSTTGNSGEGSTPTLSVTYGSGANTAVQGNTTITCPSGTGNLSGGGNSLTLGSGGSCNNISTVQNPTFTTSVTTPQLIFTGAGSNGTVQIANLGQATAFTIPDPGAASASFCLTTGNCTAIGSAAGDLTGSYPGPTIAKLQGGTLSISSVASGNILQYNGTAWVNQNISGDITLNTSAVATIANGVVTSAKIADGTIANGDLASGSFTNITGVGTLTGLTVTGAAAINTTGTANTAIGNATGTFQVTSNGGLNVSTAGALTGVSGITTSGGYTQSGTTANTFTGASSFTASGTALSVTNNATVSGTLTVNTITPNSTLTVGAAGQKFTLQGNATSVITATNGSFTTTIGFTTPTANTTLNFPALNGGPYTICTSSGNCGGVGATLQTAYDNSTNPEITLDATRGALTVRDNASAIGGNLFEVQNSGGSTTYFNVTASGTNTTGTIAASGNISSTGGSLTMQGTGANTFSGQLVVSGVATDITTPAGEDLTLQSGTKATNSATGTSLVLMGGNESGTTSVGGSVLLQGGTGTSAPGSVIVRQQAADSAGAFQVQSVATTAILSVSTASASDGVIMYAPNSAINTSSGHNWIRAPKNTVSVFVGDNDNTSAYAATDFSGNIRFNGSAVAWGDFGYYPQGGGNGNDGQFRLSTTGGNVSTTPNAKLGVGDLYVSGNAGIGTNSPSARLHATSSNTTDTVLAASTNTSGTQTNGILYNRNGASGTTTNGLNITNTAGTLSNGLTLTATTAIGNGINFTGAGGFTNLINATNFSVTNAGVVTLQGGQTTDIGVATSGAGVAGNTLTIKAGQSGSGSVNGGNLVLQGGATGGSGTTGSVIVRANGTNSTTAFQVQNSSGGYLLNVDTSGNKTTIGYLNVGISGTFDATLNTFYTAGTLNLGSTTNAGINIGATGTSTISSTINLATTSDATGTQTINIGSAANAANVVSIEGGTGASSINIGNGATAHGIKIGTNTTGANTIVIGGANASSVVSIEGGTGASGINIGNGATAHGIKIGTDATNANTIVIGSANASSVLSLEGGTGATAINIGNGATAHNIVIGTNATAGQGVTIGSTNTSSTSIVQGNTVTLQSNSSTGTVVVKSGTNNTTAFQVQNATGGSLMNVDTTNSNISFLGLNTGDLGGWTDDTGDPLPASRYGQATATVNGYIYNIGGYDSSDVAQTSVSYHRINRDGSLSYVGTTTVLPDARGHARAVVVNGYIYVVGGRNTVPATQSTVYYTKPNADGTLGSWQQANSIPNPRRNAQVVTANGYIYVISGLDNAGSVQTTVYYAKVNADGSIGVWNTDASAAPGSGRFDGTAVVANGRIYLVGGYSGASPSADVYYVSINSNGSLGTWQSLIGSMPSGRVEAASVVMNGYLYVIGGYNSGYQSTVYYAKINAPGTLGSWNTDTADPLPALRGMAGTVTVNGYVYIMGGHNSGGPATTMYYASSPRLTVGGSIDLVNYQSASMADATGDPGAGSTGGSITAGNGTFIGGLQVQGPTSLASSLVVSGTATFQSTTNVTSAFSVLNASSVKLLNVDTSTSQVTIGTADSTGALLVVDEKNTSSDPTGSNGAIYYNSGGTGGSTGGRFRCYEDDTWKNCIGMRDILERRWGAFVTYGIGASLGGMDHMGTLGGATLDAFSSTGGAQTSFTESNYYSAPTSTTLNNAAGMGPNVTNASMRRNWAPKIVTRIRTDSSAVSSVRYWVGLQDGPNMKATNPVTTAAANTTQYIGLGAASTFSGGAWICGSGDGTNHSGVSTGVTMAANTYYDIILDFSVSGTLICSISANGGAFTTVSKTTNLPAAATDLGVMESVTTLASATRTLYISYYYMESN